MCSLHELLVRVPVVGSKVGSSSLQASKIEVKSGDTCDTENIGDADTIGDTGDTGDMFSRGWYNIAGSQVDAEVDGGC